VGRKYSQQLFVNWYNQSYTIAMKTAISIPDELFTSAEQFAQQRGLTRSQLYATALRHYLQEQRRDAITDQLNAIYASESSALEPPLLSAQARTLPQDAW